MIFIKEKSMKNLFELSEEEKNRILEMHVSATKNLYLKEQLQPTQPKNVPAPDIKYSEVEASTTPEKIVSSQVLSQKGIPATPQNFRNFFWASKDGLRVSFINKDMGEFKNVDARTTKELDNIVAQYKDGSFIKLVGSGSQLFPIKNMVRLGGAGNGLLALSRAIRSGSGVLPSVIKITMGSSERVGESYNYDSGKINQTNSTFNVLLAYFIKPLVDPQKVSPTYPLKEIVLGQPNKNGTITGNINGLLSKFLPKIEGKKVMEVATEYGLDMTPEVFEQQILASGDMSNVDTKWNQIQRDIVTKYKENLDKFLTAKFPDTKVQKLGAFRPETSSNGATQEIKKVNANYGPGMAVPKINPQERKTQQNFKLGK
jgi:hypothetical protein